MSDLISRQKALASHQRMYDAKSGIEWVPVFWIENLPSAEPERKKGKWIFEECKGNTYFRCSECGEIVASAFMGFPRYEYCPMCGADMRGEEYDISRFR